MLLNIMMRVAKSKLPLIKGRFLMMDIHPLEFQLKMMDGALRRKILKKYLFHLKESEPKSLMWKAQD